MGYKIQVQNAVLILKTMEEVKTKVTVGSSPEFCSNH